MSGLSTGTAVITASDSTGKIFAKCDVTVKSVSKGNLYISRNKFATTVGKDFILKGEEGSAWSTSDSYLATVSDNGIVHAHHSGRVAITYSDSKGHKVVCAVSIGTAEPVRAVYNSPNLAKTGQQIKLLAVTDKTVSAVRFKVSRDGNSFFVNSSSKTEKNGSRASSHEKNSTYSATCKSISSAMTAKRLQARPCTCGAEVDHND